MRKALIILGICTLYGCGLFQKVQKDKHLDDSSMKAGSEKTVNEIDTGSRQTHENIKFRLHLFNSQPNGDMPSYRPPFISPTDSNASLNGAMSDLQNENQYMKGMFGYLEAELNRFVNEKKGTTKQTKERDTVTVTQTVYNSSTKKSPGFNWMEIAGICVAILILKDLFKWIASKVIKK